MDLELFGKGLAYVKKRRKWAFLAALTCYGVHKLYNSKFLAAFVSLAQTLSHSAAAVGILSEDLDRFLRSDSDRVPRSLRQLSKLAASRECSEALAAIARASASGILAASSPGDRGLPDRVVDRVLSEAGAGFASQVVGSFARNAVMALASEWRQRGGGSGAGWIEVACEDRCREMVGDAIRQFVSAAVGVYLEKTAHVNAYEEFFAGLTSPKQENRVKEMLVSVCNNAVDTCVRTSYHVWRANSKLHSDEKGGGGRGRQPRRTGENGWMTAMRVPGNGRLVLDAAGVATFEGVRSFLEKVAEGVDVVQQEVVEKGAEAIRYTSRRSSAATALCLTLCLNILNSPWILTHYI